MKPKSASFITSATKPNGFPPPDLPEVAFAGRSNVGKSALINMIAGTPGLAKTSRTPGRTRLLNWFRVQPQKGVPVAFVDLPGYGYAKVPREMRDSWRPMVESYLKNREVLRAVVLLIDTRRGAQEEEAELVEWLASEDVTVQVVLTKADKLAKARRKPVALAVKRELGLAREPLITSAHNREGIVELWRFISKTV